MSFQVLKSAADNEPKRRSTPGPSRGAAAGAAFAAAEPPRLPAATPPGVAGGRRGDTRSPAGAVGAATSGREESGWKERPKEQGHPTRGRGAREGRPLAGATRGRGEVAGSPQPALKEQRAPPLL